MACCIILEGRKEGKRERRVQSADNREGNPDCACACVAYVGEHVLHR